MALEKDLVPGKKYYLDSKITETGVFKNRVGNYVYFEVDGSEKYIVEDGTVGFRVENFDYTEVPD